MYKITSHLHQLGLQPVEEGFVESYHLLHRVDLLVHLHLDLLVVFTRLLEVSAEEFLDVGSVDEVIEDLGKEFVGFFEVGLAEAAGDVHEVFDVVEDSVLCLVYLAAVRRDDSHLRPECADLHQAHMDALPCASLACYFLQLPQLLAPLLLALQSLVALQQFAQVDYEVIRLEEHVVHEVVHRALVALFFRLVPREEDLEPKEELVVLALFSLHQISIIRSISITRSGKAWSGLPRPLARRSRPGPCCAGSRTPARFLA